MLRPYWLLAVRPYCLLAVRISGAAFVKRLFENLCAFLGGAAHCHKNTGSLPPRGRDWSGRPAGRPDRAPSLLMPLIYQDFNQNIPRGAGFHCLDKALVKAYYQWLVELAALQRPRAEPFPPVSSRPQR